MVFRKNMNNNILNILRSVLLERIDLGDIPDDIWKRSSALNTWGTNAIEGSTITWEDAERILFKGKSVNNRPIRDLIETVQHDSAFKGLLKRRKGPIGLVTVLELHDEVFRGVLLDAGSWRRVNVRIMGADFHPPRMEKVLPMMEKWLAEYTRRDLEGEDVFSQGAWMHYEFERIHPFQDGNGRVGRLLLNLHFLRHNWPTVHVLPVDRDDYLDSLSSFQNGDTGPLKNLLVRLMGSSLLDLLDQVGTSEDELISLNEAENNSTHDRKYLSLRCKQGELPGVLSKHRWRTSRRALGLYSKYTGRGASTKSILKN
jgi:Fic family protein